MFPNSAGFSLLKFHNILNCKAFFPSFSIGRAGFRKGAGRLAGAWLRPYAGGGTARLPAWSVFLLCVIAGVCEESDRSDEADPPPEGAAATISITPAELEEWASDKTARVTVAISEALDGPLGVQLATSGDAIAGGDYDLEDAALTIAAGETSASTEIRPLRDFEEEGAESAEIRISALSGNADAVIGTPAAASFIILDQGRFPNPKTSLAADLLAIAGDTTILPDKIVLRARVLNWGAVRSSPTVMGVVVNDQPDWRQSSLWQGEANVLAMDPKWGQFFLFEIRLDELAPGRDYYGLIDVLEVAEERRGRRYTNQDYFGFSLNASGRVVVRCRTDAGAAPGAADPLAAEQWHLVNRQQRAFADQAGASGEDLGMDAAVTDGPFGQGVKIAIADTGLETCHPDLAANIEAGASHNFNGGHWTGARNNDPFLPSTMGDHGTSVAGVAAAAANNGVGGRGVAPRARLRGFNLLTAHSNDWEFAFADALGGSGDRPNSTDVDIFNLSFSSLGDEENPHPDLEAGLLRNGVRNLRQGRGAIYVKAAGNGFGACRSLHRPVNDAIGCLSANADALNNLPYLMVVGGFNAAGRRASYSSAGANLWVSAPSGEYGGSFPAIITTDQAGRSRGYDAFIQVGLANNASLNPKGNYISTFNGTSAAAPNAAGAVALLLEAHPELTWRDVKHILAKTARQLDPDAPAVRYGFGGGGYSLLLPWVTNAAGYRFHNHYGFGAIDVDAALAYAAAHRPDSLGEFVETPPFGSSAGAAIPDHQGDGLRQRLAVSGLPAEANIEAVTLEIDLTHPFTNDLGIHLISPAGTESIVNPAFNEALAGDADLNWQLLSNAFYGESPNGEWRLKIVDAAPGDAGRLNSWRLRFALGTHL